MEEAATCLIREGQVRDASIKDVFDLFCREFCVFPTPPLPSAMRSFEEDMRHANKVLRTKTGKKSAVSRQQKPKSGMSIAPRKVRNITAVDKNLLKSALVKNMKNNFSAGDLTKRVNPSAPLPSKMPSKTQSVPTMLAPGAKASFRKAAELAKLGIIMRPPPGPPPPT